MDSVRPWLYAWMALALAWPASGAQAAKRPGKQDKARASSERPAREDPARSTAAADPWIVRWYLEKAPAQAVEGGKPGTGRARKARSGLPSAARLAGLSRIERILSTLATIPEFEERSRRANASIEDGSLEVHFEDDRNAKHLGVFRPNAGDDSIALNHHTMKANGLGEGDVTLTAAHELFHATNVAILGKDLEANLDNLPPQLASRDPRNIPGLKIELPHGVFVQWTFWYKLEEESAFDGEERIFNGARRDLFQGPNATLPVNHPPVPIFETQPRGAFRETLLNRGFSDRQIHGFELPEQVTWIQRRLLSDFVKPEGRPQLSVHTLDAEAPYFNRYMRLSWAEIREGALLADAAPEMPSSIPDKSIQRLFVDHAERAEVPPPDTRPADQIRKERRTLKRRGARELAEVDRQRKRAGLPDVPTLIAALNAFPEFETRQRLAMDLGKRGRLWVSYETASMAREASWQRHTAPTSLTFSDWGAGIVLKPKAMHALGLKAGDAVLRMVSELTRATDPEVLGAKLEGALGNLPRDLVSRDPKNLAGGLAVELPSRIGRIFVERAFWNYLTQRSAGEEVDRVYRGARRNFFHGPGARLRTTKPPASAEATVPRTLARHQLISAGFSGSEVAALRLPYRVPELQIALLRGFVPRRAGLRPDVPSTVHDGAFDPRGAHFDRYIGRSVAEILQGALLRTD